MPRAGRPGRGGAPALAVDKPENVNKYRQSVMKAVGARTGAIAGVVKGEVSYVGDVAAIGARLPNLGKACGGCHKPFRAEKK